jgi:hypothetical protein
VRRSLLIHRLRTVTQNSDFGPSDLAAPNKTHRPNFVFPSNSLVDGELGEEGLLHRTQRLGAPFKPGFGLSGITALDMLFCH